MDDSLRPITLSSQRLEPDSALPLHELIDFSTARTEDSSAQLPDLVSTSLSRNDRGHSTAEPADSFSDDSDDQRHSLDQTQQRLLPDPNHQQSMSRRASKSPNPRARKEKTNGSSATANGSKDMNANIHERRKPTVSLEIPGDTAEQSARLMGHSSFSLNDEPALKSPLTPHEQSSKGFFELPEQDRRNFLLLVLLYFLQGIPMGLAGGSVPFLLKNYLSYGQIGIYSLASYPYSLKLLWSPIVDAVWSTRVGRRKSWILPIQLLSGVGMIWLGSGAQKMMTDAGQGGGAGVWNFTGWWFALVFMCATQDIAVDGRTETSGQDTPSNS